MLQPNGILTVDDNAQWMFVLPYLKEKPGGPWDYTKACRVAGFGVGENRIAIIGIYAVNPQSISTEYALEITSIDMVDLCNLFITLCFTLYTSGRLRDRFSEIIEKSDG